VRIVFTMSTIVTRKQPAVGGGDSNQVPEPPLPSGARELAAFGEVASNTSGLETAALYRLMAWLSPAYPVGAFSYSGGLEWAVEAGDIAEAASLLRWLR